MGRRNAGSFGISPDVQQVVLQQSGVIVVVEQPVIQTTEEAAGKRRTLIDGGSDEESDDFWPWTQETEGTSNSSVNERGPDEDAFWTWQSTLEESAATERRPLVRNESHEGQVGIKKVDIDSVGHPRCQTAVVDLSHDRVVDAVFAQCEVENPTPSWGQEAPPFTLETHDKSRRISLADYRGKKPVVLIFGSFT